ncbi:Hypp2924 [Branchiostoma lanceolatum]|uniref:Hypp2924 protein n=1 Tax=Branchiostoma lanceolatum TaxID=7740 RepID=A0A8K0EPW4_BRALA|nr:Hypp2924 [Branchiostoma lanceolatum]
MPSRHSLPYSPFSSFTYRPTEGMLYAPYIAQEVRKLDEISGNDEGRPCPTAGGDLRGHGCGGQAGKYRTVAVGQGGR